MDINELNTKAAHDEGAEMQVKDQFDKKTDCYIKTVGMDSKVWRDLMRSASKPHCELSENEVLARACIDWRGFDDGGEPLEFSYERVIGLFVDAPYIADQVDRFIAKRANFTKR